MSAPRRPAAVSYTHLDVYKRQDTQCTYLEEDGILFTGDVFGCHFCDARLFNDRVGDFRFSFEYYYCLLYTSRCV